MPIGPDGRDYVGAKILRIAHEVGNVAVSSDDLRNGFMFVEVGGDRTLFVSMRALNAWGEVRLIRYLRREFESG